MAQIIKHRRGSLESVASATKRAGELLVVTGSAGITAANGDSLLFLGVDGSTVTPANKFLQGTSVPDLTGASYDTSIDGIPFYDTSAEKLYILNKAGNVEVKATANTDGTGIVSSSAQVDALGFLQVNGDAVVSSSAQISGYNTFLEINGDSVVSSSAQVSAYNTFLEINGDGVHSGSAQVVSAIASQNVNLGGISGSSLDITGNAKIDGNLVLGGNITIGDASSDTISFGGDVASDIIPSATNTYDLGSATDKFAEIHATTLFGSISATNGVVSGSSQITDGSGIVSSSAQVSAYNTFLEINGDGVVSGSEQIDGTSIQNNTITIAGNSTALGGSVSLASITNGSGIISGSGQLLNVATDFGSGRVSGDDFGDVAGTSTFTGSFVGDGSGLTGLATNLIISGGTGNDEVDLLNDALSIVGTSNEIETTVTNNQVQIGLPSNVTIGNNLTVVGNLEVQGTTTTVDSTTITLGDNIIELNGSGASNGGLLVKDVTNPNTISGSLLWDSTNDYWKAGALGGEERILLANGDGVVSGSAQITLTSADNAGFNTSYVAEDASRLYYTDTRVKTKLNTETVVSSSAQVSAYGVFAELNGDSLVSSSAQISGYNTFLEINGDSVVSSSAQVSAYGVFAELNGDNLVSSSAQISGYNTFLEINGDGVHSGSAQVVSSLLNQDIDFGTGGISGSTLDITGNAKIDGNLVLGGNITIGDQSSDTISFGGEVSSHIIPDVTNTYDLGSSTNRWRDLYLSGSTIDLGGTLLQRKSDTGHIQFIDSATLAVLSAEVSFDTLLDKPTLISSSTQLDGTTLGSTSEIIGSGSFSGSFVGDGSGLTGIATDLVISGSTGNDTLDLLTDALSFAGGTGVTAAVTDNTVTYSVQDASTSAKGIASFGSTNFAVTSGNVTIKAGGVPATALNADVAGTGISLNGVDNSIEVDYGSTAGTAVEGNTSLTVQGTSNEIEVSGGSVTLGSGGTVTVGLPNDVTIGNDLTVTNDLSVTGNATITGNLSVLGTTTTIDSTTVQLGDNVLELNYGGAQDTAGLLVTDSTAPNTVSGSLLWDGTNDYWKGGALGSEKEFARLNTSPTSNTVLKADANGLLVDSLITDDGTNVTISGTAELRINAATANSFVYFDSNKSLEAVTPSNAGDVIQWNGSSFVASNEIDGGTF